MSVYTPPMSVERTSVRGRLSSRWAFLFVPCPLQSKSVRGHARSTLVSAYSALAVPVTHTSTYDLETENAKPPQQALRSCKNAGARPGDRACPHCLLHDGVGEALAAWVGFCFIFALLEVEPRASPRAGSCSTLRHIPAVCVCPLHKRTELYSPIMHTHALAHVHYSKYFLSVRVDPSLIIRSWCLWSSSLQAPRAGPAVLAAPRAPQAMS